LHCAETLLPTVYSTRVSYAETSAPERAVLSHGLPHFTQRCCYESAKYSPASLLKSTFCERGMKNPMQQVCGLVRLAISIRNTKSVALLLSCSLCCRRAKNKPSLKGLLARWYLFWEGRSSPDRTIVGYAVDDARNRCLTTPKLALGYTHSSYGDQEHECPIGFFQVIPELGNFGWLKGHLRLNTSL